MVRRTVVVNVQNSYKGLQPFYNPFQIDANQYFSVNFFQKKIFRTIMNPKDFQPMKEVKRR